MTPRGIPSLILRSSLRRFAEAQNILLLAVIFLGGSSSQGDGSGKRLDFFPEEMEAQGKGHVFAVGNQGWVD